MVKQNLPHFEISTLFLMFRPATVKPTTQKPSEGNGQWTPDPNPGQWEWKPPTTTTTETSFIETSNVAEPLTGDYKVVCCKFFFFFTMHTIQMLK